ncbi:MAG: hypothetical protein MZU97_20060 [Bacillus subtilis]|nr:hypothetical protein [Bacillus subtilis]
MGRRDPDVADIATATGSISSIPGGDSAYKGYGFTTPFIYQFGGEVYNSKWHRIDRSATLRRFARSSS